MKSFVKALTVFTLALTLTVTGFSTAADMNSGIMLAHDGPGNEFIHIIKK